MTKSNFDLRHPRVSLVEPDGLRMNTLDHHRLVDVMEIRPDSRASLRRAVWWCASNFRREMEYMAVFGFEGRDADPDYRAFLFLATEDHIQELGHALGRRPRDKKTVIGAVCFRKREHGYALQFAWLTPTARHRGFLTDAWQFFEPAVGPFTVEGPVSKSMRAVIQKAIRPVSVT